MIKTNGMKVGDTVKARDGGYLGTIGKLLVGGWAWVRWKGDSVEGRICRVADIERVEEEAEAAMKQERYYLKADFQEEWQQVTKEQFIKAERAAGFRPKCASSDPAYMTMLATGGFGGGGVQGQIRHE